MITRIAAGLASPHGFLGATGGVSEGLHASLNCGLGSADDGARVAENRRRAAHEVAPAARLVSLHQVHSADCVIAADWPDSGRPRADALVTDRPGIVLGILTADCVPVLFEDARAGVVAAAHAGWKGALGGVLENTLAAMESLGASRNAIAAAVGPCIRRASYEVTDAFAEPFLAADTENARFFTPGAHPGRLQFDLPGYCLARLAAAGVRRIHDTGLDTYADPRFFSYRRATHAAAPDYGRQLSLIALR